jgi:hypothetical protein
MKVELFDILKYLSKQKLIYKKLERNSREYMIKQIKNGDISDDALKSAKDYRKEHFILWSIQKDLIKKYEN